MFFLDFASDGSICQYVPKTLTETELVTILADLLENAIHATVSAGGERIFLYMGLRDGSFAIEVSDTGVPFPAEVAAAYGKGRFTTRAKEGGTGIGLATLHDILNKAKAEYYVRQHQDNEVIARLKTNVPLTGADVKVLEEILWSEIGTREEYEAEYGSKPLGEFVREIVGLDMNAAKAAFAEFLNDANLDSRQICFVNQIVEYIVHNGMMKDLSVLQEVPFTDQGSIVEVFADLTVWMGIRRVIEQVNANASAA